MDVVLVFLIFIFALMTGNATAKAELIPGKRDSYMGAAFITIMLTFGCMTWLITRM